MAFDRIKGWIKGREDKKIQKILREVEEARKKELKKLQETVKRIRENIDNLQNGELVKYYQDRLEKDANFDFSKINEFKRSLAYLEEEVNESIAEEAERRKKEEGERLKAIPEDYGIKWFKPERKEPEERDEVRKIKEKVIQMYPRKTFRYIREWLDRLVETKYISEEERDYIIKSVKNYYKPLELKKLALAPVPPISCFNKQGKKPKLPKNVELERITELKKKS